jgi:hypothetical protein
LKFKQHSSGDLKTFMAAFKKGEQIGFARFGDGEERMYLGGTYHCSDGWVSRPDPKSKLRKGVAKAIRFKHPNYYVGLRTPKSLKMWAWTVANVKTPPERICDPCLFVNARWGPARKFFLQQRRKCFLVGSGKGVNYKIPHNCIQPEYNWTKLLKKLLTVKKPILLAAGPLANVLVMEYLQKGGKQSIIDIGTVLDFELFGKSTRGYMRRALAKKRRKPAIKSAKKAKRKKTKKPKRAKRKRRQARRPAPRAKKRRHR